MIVKLEGLDFFAHHGYYEGERKTGNKYTIDVSIEILDPKEINDDDLDTTVNYEIVYSKVSEIMTKSTKLLETLAFLINQEILKEFDKVLSVESTVSKHNPPIKGVCKKASISLKTVR